MLTTSTAQGYDASKSTFYPVVIIGAGMGGIGLACNLKRQLGFDQFRIFERQSGIGGTWWINRYPGIACDIPAAFYSFSFRQNPDWTAFFPSGEEILRYQQTVVEEFHLIDKIQLNTDVSLCRWDEVRQEWEITVRRLVPGLGDLSAAERRSRIDTDGPSTVYVAEEEVVRCKILISAVGGLVEPRAWPTNVPGLDRFQGEVFHSARWNHDIDLQGKDVVVVGTGCSASQFVPLLPGSDIGAARVTQVMREPPWVVPRVHPPLGDQKWASWGPWLCRNIPGFMPLLRGIIASTTEADFLYFGASAASGKARQKLAKELTEHIQKAAPKKYHEILTPNYDVGCKRRIYDTMWFTSLHDPRVELTTLALTSVQEDTVTLSVSEKTHPSERQKGETTIPADVIILANGFEVNRWFHPLKVHGIGGKSLQSVFDERGGPQMYLGIAMDGFPNLFTLFGPNSFTGHSSVVLGLENQIGHALKLMRPILEGDASQVAVKRNAVLAYNQRIQADLKDMVWNSGGCSSWYLTKDGHNSVSYPYSMLWQTLRFAFPTWSDWSVSLTSQGLRRRRIGHLAKLLGFGALIFSLAYLVPGTTELRTKLGLLLAVYSRKAKDLSS